MRRRAVGTLLVAMLVALDACGRLGFDPVADGTFVDCADVTAGASCYQLFLTPLVWEEAQRVCADLGPTAHLATISSFAENTFAFAYADTIPIPDPLPGVRQRQNMWLGATDAETEGAFEWVSGEPFSFVNFDDGEPNDQGGEDCVVLLGEVDGVWDDRDCLDEHEFLCERD